VFFLLQEEKKLAAVLPAKRAGQFVACEKKSNEIRANLSSQHQSPCRLFSLPTFCGCLRHFPHSLSRLFGRKNFEFSNEFTAGRYFLFPRGIHRFSLQWVDGRQSPFSDANTI
jgi:hypothetical protein